MGKFGVDMTGVRTREERNGNGGEIESMTWTGGEGNIMDN